MDCPFCGHWMRRGWVRVPLFPFGVVRWEASDGRREKAEVLSGNWPRRRRPGRRCEACEAVVIYPAADADPAEATPDPTEGPP